MSGGRAAVSELLVRDRLAEFQQQAQSRGALQAGLGRSSGSFGPDGAPAPAAKPAGKGNTGFMREFFERISAIQSSINRGRANVKQMSDVLEEALLATTSERERVVSQRLQDLVQETNGRISEVKRALDDLRLRSEEEEKKRPNSQEGKIRKNMQQAMAKKHQQLLLDFQKAQVDFKQALQKRQRREMEILMPDATEEERDEMIEAGETPSLVVAKKMAGAHALVLDEVQRVHEKHQDILRLERSIADLAQMFQEMAVLVEAQGEMLDAIEVHVHKAVGYTAKAEKELITARKAQHNTQKWMCCLTVFIVILLIVILGPVLVK